MDTPRITLQCISELATQVYLTVEKTKPNELQQQVKSQLESYQSIEVI